MDATTTKPASQGKCGRVDCDAAADLAAATRHDVSTWTIRLDCFAHAPLRILAAAAKAANA